MPSPIISENDLKNEALSLIKQIKDTETISNDIVCQLINRYIERCEKIASGGEIQIQQATTVYGSGCRTQTNDYNTYSITRYPLIEDITKDIISELSLSGRDIDSITLNNLNGLI